MDLTFVTDSGKFNYRVGAIIIQDEKLLMVKNKYAPYYYSVGGRVKLHETAEDAVIREVFEETGLQMSIERLGYIHENLFIEDVTKERFHELSMFFFMKGIDASSSFCASLTENGAEEMLHWLPLNKLDDLYLYPEFFKEKLLHPSLSVEHILTIDQNLGF